MTGDIAAQNAELVREHFEALWNEGAPDEDRLHPNYRVHSQTEDPVTGDAFHRRVAGLRETFPDMRMSVEAVVADDDTVVVRHRWTGTQEEPFELVDGSVIPPTGTTVEMAGMAAFRVDDGAIREARYVEDTLGMLEQLGALPD